MITRVSRIHLNRNQKRAGVEFESLDDNGKKVLGKGRVMLEVDAADFFAAVGKRLATMSDLVATNATPLNVSALLSQAQSATTLHESAKEKLARAVAEVADLTARHAELSTQIDDMQKALAPEVETAPEIAEHDELEPG